MDPRDIVIEIDREIARLTQARNLLAGTGTTTEKAARPVKRILSSEARKRIADAQRKRWAAQKKAAK